MKSLLLAVSVLALIAGANIPEAQAKGDGGAACIKRQLAKGRTQCIAKAICDGISSRKQQAAMCG